MPDYVPSEEERAAYMYCMRNNIRISPGGTKDPNEWTIDISLDGKTWNKSPKSYGREEVWKKYYEICAYYKRKAL